jgi:predicted Rossmann-fold nucleotide-binding protein
MPGGFGTLDELFETLTLKQTGKVHDFPVIIMGKEYWAPAAELLNKMVAARTIGRDDMNLLHFTDSVDEVLDIIRTRSIKPFGLKLARPSRVLGEHGVPVRSLNVHP